MLNFISSFESVHFALAMGLVLWGLATIISIRLRSSEIHKIQMSREEDRRAEADHQRYIQRAALPAPKDAKIIDG